MVEAFFGLQQEPFSIAPDPRFLFMSAKHSEALVLLNLGLTRGASFVLLTGEIGAGKTTVWRRFLEQLPSNVDVASVVNPKLDVNSVSDLIALAKRKPDALSYGASGVGSGPHLATELFKQMAGIKMTGVLYPGSAQTTTDLIAGRIQVMFAPASSVLGFIKAGTVKPLATSQAKRASVAPDLPTVAESGLPGFDTGLWFGMLAPAGTPAPVIKRLSKAINDSLKDPGVLNALKTQGFDPLGSSPDDFARYIKSETERWARVIHSMDTSQAK